MHIIVGGLRQGPRAIALALMAVGVAGCSVDSTRFNDSPFPSGQVEATGAPVGRIDQQSLSPPQGGYGENQNGYGGNYNSGYGGNQNGYGGNQNGGYGGSNNPGYNGSPNGGYGSPQG